MLYSKEIINELKNKVDIVKIIGEFVDLKKSGNNYVGLCPFHDDSNPSFFTSNNKKIYKCFSCNEGGNAIDFISKIKKIDYDNAIQFVAEKTNFKLPLIKNKFLQKNNDQEIFFSMNQQALSIYKKILYIEDNKEVLNYLYSKGLNDELIDFFNIGYAPNKKNQLFQIMNNYKNFIPNKKKDEIWSEIQLIKSGLIFLDSNNEYMDYFRNRIIFPIFNINNNVVGFSGRTINKNDNLKYLISKSNDFFKKDNELFNIQNIDKNNSDKLYITEGFMDVISLYKNDYKNSIALMGTNMSNNHIYNLLNNFKFKTIVIAMDNDEAGYKANIEIGQKILNFIQNNNKFKKHKPIIMIINKYDSKYKDLGEIINFSKINFEKILNSNSTYIEYLINYKFSKINIELMDEKLNLLNDLEDFISIYSDWNLINYYANILVEKTNLSFDNIYESIMKKQQNNLNLINWTNPDIFGNKINDNEIDYSIFYENVISNLEKKLLNLMIIDPNITSIFIEKLNYLNIERKNNNYRDLKLLILISYHCNNNYEYQEVLNRIRISKLPLNIKNYIEFETNEIIKKLKNKIYSNEDLINQAKEILEELLIKKSRLIILK